jgi:glycogen operon protein
VRAWPGRPYPLGARYDGAGTNVSVFSETADLVELCLFDDAGAETRVPLPECTGFCWHGYFPDLAPGQRYGFRVHGPWDPSAGQRCHPSKLLLDPYALAVEGRVRWDDAVFDHLPGDPEGGPNPADSAPFVPRSVVTNPWFDWSGDRQPRTPWHDTIVYEAHVKGLTALHPEVPPELRGTYLGVAHPAVIEHLQRLRVTALELLPVHQFVHDRRLVEQGLSNYWGYNSIGYFAPHNAYAVGGQRGQQVNEFKQMVRALHDAGIEVILDVVYNHTAEGGREGPTLSFRGLDNPAYYRLDAEDPRRYVDYTGTGNSMNMRHPHVLQLIMDSLRHWVTEMHVDGFRFDLAATLARELHDVDRLSAFFDLIQQDPIVSQVKLIAEPWDVGEGGYQVGNFPTLWTEWNGKYRDTVRDFWRGADNTLGGLAARMSGSSDLYETSGRRPFASINFVTCHDGFTLADLVSYDRKHNEANGEDNRDGSDDNRSWNCGVEGPTDDVAVEELRARQRRNFAATLLLAQGVPMLLAGDEMGNSQAGNNNAYCQDSEVSWLPWPIADEAFAAYVRWLTAFRREHPVLRRRRWLTGGPVNGSGLPDAAWFNPAGAEMCADDWGRSDARTVGLFLNGEGISGADDQGRLIEDDTFLLLFSSSAQRQAFTLPPASWGTHWSKVLDTIDAMPGASASSVHPAGAVLNLEPRSTVVLQRS